MRKIAAILLVARGAAADPQLSEYGPGPLRPASQLVSAGCELDVDIRGAIVVGQLREHVANPGPAPLAAALEIELPKGAQITGASVGREAAVAVAAGAPSQVITSQQVLAADPAFVQALLPDADGRARFRATLQPIDVDREATLTIDWTAVASVREGVMHVVLPGRGALATCKGRVRVSPGPGVGVQQVRAGAAAVTPHGAVPFKLEAADLDLEITLAFASLDPVAWLQRAPLGDGSSADAVTVLAPPVRANGGRRVLFVVDASRSMELVGRRTVTKVIHAIGTSLPQGSELEAIIFDRTATRVLGAWQPADADHLASIEAAVAGHPASNGSDAAAALALARTIIADRPKGQPMVIAITDGVFGGISDDTLAHALTVKASDLDLHAIVLDPGHLKSPGEAALRAPITHVGGSYVEVGIADLDNALAELDSWLRPAWLDLALQSSTVEIPSQVRAGSGFVAFGITKGGGTPKLTGHADVAIAQTLRAAPSAPIGQLLHPAVDQEHALAVLSTGGKVAANRRAMIAGGGPYTRMIAVDDPAFPPESAQAANVTYGSALDRGILDRLFKLQLQPKAYSCYQKALVADQKLAGSVTFHFDIGRGEITRASVTGFNDPAFDACLLDAAYALAPPVPTLDVNVDDRSVVNYTLAFSVHQNHPLIIPGDADSATPLDIDAIKGGVPRHVKAGDTSTPLGDLRPSPGP